MDIPYDRSDRGRHLGVIKSGDYMIPVIVFAALAVYGLVVAMKKCKD